MGKNSAAEQVQTGEWSRYSRQMDMLMRVRELRGLDDHRGASRVAGDLIVALQPVLLGAARSLKARWGSLMLEDLMQVGAIELIKAIDTFDLTKSQSFANWVYFRARRAMLNQTRLHSADVKPSDGAQRGRVKKLAVEAHVQVFSRDEPYSGPGPSGADDPAFSGTVQHSSNKTLGAEESVSPEQALDAAQMDVLMRRCINRLPQSMSDLVAWVHGIGRPEKSLREIAREKGQPRAKLDAMLKRGEQLLRKMVEREINARHRR